MRVLQAHELADWVVGAPKAPGDYPLQLIQVQGAMGQVWEGLGVHTSDLQVEEDTGSDKSGGPAAPTGQREGSSGGEAKALILTLPCSSSGPQDPSSSCVSEPRWGEYRSPC